MTQEVAGRDLSIPGYWLLPEDIDTAVGYLHGGDAQSVFEMPLHEVSSDPDIHIAVIGETLSLLHGHGITFGRSYRLPAEFLLVQFLTKDEALELKPAIEQFLASAKDEVLSDDNENFLTLYQGDPNLIRRALAYLTRLLSVPCEYGAVIVLNR